MPGRSGLAAAHGMMCTRRFSARASLDDAQCLNAENQHRISLEHVACLPLHSPHPQHLSPARPLWTRVSSRLAPSYPSFSHPARLFLLLSAAARRPVPAVREAPVAGEPPSLPSPRSPPRLDGWAVALTTRNTSELGTGIDSLGSVAHRFPDLTWWEIAHWFACDIAAK